MAKAILFDLDGTLLSVHTEEFVHHYMRALVPHVQSAIPPEKFMKSLWDATGEMIKSKDAKITNEEVFIKHFIETTGVKKDEIWPIFDQFYSEHFPKLIKHTNPSPLAKEIVSIAKEQGRKIAIATNPVFPKTAIYERLNWLGLLDFPFDLVTVYEESHFCKPNPNYFKEVLEKIKVEPHDAIMVGNDVQEDMVAGKIGMDTFLVTDYLIDRGEPSYPITQKGTLTELKHQLENRIGIFAL